MASTGDHRRNAHCSERRYPDPMGPLMARSESSGAVIILVADQPVQSEPIDDLTVGCPPRSLLQIIDDSTTF